MSRGKRIWKKRQQTTSRASEFVLLCTAVTGNLLKSWPPGSVLFLFFHLSRHRDAVFYRTSEGIIGTVEWQRPYHMFGSIVIRINSSTGTSHCYEPNDTVVALNFTVSNSVRQNDSRCSGKELRGSASRIGTSRLSLGRWTRSWLNSLGLRLGPEFGWVWVQVSLAEENFRECESGSEKFLWVWARVYRKLQIYFKCEPEWSLKVSPIYGVKTCLRGQFSLCD